MHQVFLETPRLILRQWKESDYESYIALNADAEVMEFLPSVLSREDTLAQIGRITEHIEKHGFGLFAVERKDNGQFIGFAGFNHTGFESDFTPCIEVGWRLSRENWGQGFATEAAKACLVYGFEQLNLDEIYSFTSVHNTRSENVMKKAGMTMEGTFNHPLVADESFLKQHLLYKIAKDQKAQ